LRPRNMNVTVLDRINVWWLDRLTIYIEDKTASSLEFGAIANFLAALHSRFVASGMEMCKLNML
jgi:hypothetical protein